MIRDARVLRAGFVPREVEHRDAAVNHLSSILDPVTAGEPAATAVLTGPSGAGKTCIATFVTDRLREAANAVETTYVNCWRNYTRFRTLYQVLDDCGTTVDIKRQSTPHDELIDRLQRYDGPRRVVILDEADQLADPGVIYHLHSLSQFTVILIVNREADLFGRVDDRLVSRLRASEHVHLDQYHDHQLVDILAARVKWGLDPECITTSQLERIADAAGDARLAIGILRTAASTAERAGGDTITDERLLDAAENARAELRQKNLESLTPHQRVIHDIVRSDGPLAPSDIHERYQTEVEEPRTQRTVRTYLSKLERYNILEAWGTSHDRKYDVVEAAAPAPAD